jgi:Xaa-Pro dipeptidase
MNAQPAPTVAPEVLAAVQAELRERGVDALIVQSPWTVAYVLGFRYLSVDRLVCGVVPAAGPCTLVVPEYESEAALTAAGELAQVRAWSDGERPDDAVAAALASLPPRARVGIEKDALPVAELERLQALRPGDTHVDCGAWLDAMRATKRQDELALIADAAAVADRTVERFVAESLRQDRTEAELGADLTRLLRLEGGDWTAFPPNVTSGPRSALPHGPDLSARRGTAVGADRVATGQLIIVDFSVICGGYCADISRTYVLGRASDRIRELYAVVRRAHAAAMAATLPGVTAADVDRAARAIIEDAGLGAYFPQRTGHGLGLRIHEIPDLTVGNQVRLEPGMVAAIEPAVYLPGFGGIRIEDVVVVGDDPPERLTNASDELELPIGPTATGGT